MISLAQAHDASKRLKNSGSGFIDSSVDISIWFDVENEDNAEKLDLTTVEKIELDENMFSVLPTLNISLVDNGTYFNTMPMKVGRKIFIRIQPNPKNDTDKEIKPIISRMTVETTAMKIHPNTGSSYLIVNCCLDSQGIINEIVDYPKQNLLSVSTTENSSETIANVCGSVGIPLVSEIEPLDYMAWVNSTLTAKKFIDKIVNHSWVAENDSSLFYVDIEGIAHYTSIKKLTQKSDKLKTISQVNLDYLKQITDSKSLYETVLSPEGTLIFQDLKHINLGARVNNIGGGVQKTSFYDTIGINDKILLATLDKTSNPDVLNSSLNENPDNGYVRYDASSDDIYLGSESNREAAQSTKNNRSRQAGLFSTNVHPWYDIAEANNYVIKLGFFQNFWHITMDINKQPSYFYENPNLFPRIGKLIEVDFTNSSEANEIYSGKYLITRVRHIWTNGNSYAVGLTLCADGYFTSQKKCKYIDKCKNKANCSLRKNFDICKFYNGNKIDSR